MAVAIMPIFLDLYILVKLFCFFSPYAYTKQTSKKAAMICSETLEQKQGASLFPLNGGEKQIPSLVLYNLCYKCTREI
jgi:hypothetical protein